MSGYGFLASIRVGGFNSPRCFSGTCQWLSYEAIVLSWRLRCKSIALARAGGSVGFNGSGESQWLSRKLRFTERFYHKSMVSMLFQAVVRETLVNHGVLNMGAKHLKPSLARKFTKNLQAHSRRQPKDQRISQRLATLYTSHLRWP